MNRFHGGIHPDRMAGLELPETGGLFLAGMHLPRNFLLEKGVQAIIDYRILADRRKFAVSTKANHDRRSFFNEIQ